VVNPTIPETHSCVPSRGTRDIRHYRAHAEQPGGPPEGCGPEQRLSMTRQLALFAATVVAGTVAFVVVDYLIERNIWWSVPIVPLLVVSVIALHRASRRDERHTE
jgi:hypothetical protein